jgi:hypothetical protein
MAEPDDITATDSVPPVRGGGLSGARRARWPLVLVLVWATLALADIAIFHSGADSGHAAAKAAAAPGLAAHGHNASDARLRVLPSAHRSALVRVLAPASASAFGPGGLGSGDNPQDAYLAIDASTATAWVSRWYRTPQFGGLQAGTGLLIDMGRSVKITSVRILLGSASGADLQLLTGKVPDLAGLRLQASASDIGGRVRLKLAKPERARYLLVWFTLLPPDSSGTFQVSVYDVRIVGMP